MKTVSNEIILRPRFQLKLDVTKESALISFQDVAQSRFIIKILDDHVFIKLSENETHFWSPQLQLEVIEDNDETVVYGLFGPNPTLWTFFMFLHFGLATLFIILGIWAYSSAALGRPYGLQVGFMVFSVVLWFVLYFFGRYGKKKGASQMNDLHAFMKKTLEI